MKKNPMMAVIGNPPNNSDWSERVYSIQYKHAKDGDDYEHEFTPGVCLRKLPNGSVLLYHKRGLNIWEDFPA